MFSDLEILLKSIRNQNAVYVPNYGNAGDSFIAHSTYQLFGKVGLNVQMGNLSGIYPGRIVICAGGGNLVKPYPNMIDFLRRNIDQWKQLIILPHTIRAYEDTISHFGSNCFVFCREKPSFDFVVSTSPRANTLLTPDLAFSCDFGETKRQMADQRASDFRIRKLLIRNAKRLVRSINYGFMSAGGKERTLNAFRTDVEKTLIDVPRPNIDLSQAFAADDPLPTSSLHATYWLMRFISKFEIVRTNRLHIGIMSAMLGKQVDLFDNSYGKIRDVFDYSLREQFPNVRWQDADKDVGKGNAVKCKA